MSNKKLAILGIIAAVMLVWAIVQSKLSSKSRAISEGVTYLVSGVNTDDIDSIVIKSGDKNVTLKRQSGRFVVVDKGNYPAETKTINELITNCLEIKISPKWITDNSTNYENLGVTEENAQTIVKFLKPDSSELVGIIIGNTKENGQGTYVRLASNDKVYETSEAPWINSDAVNYVETQITSLVRNDISLVTVTSPDGKYILKPMADSEDLELVNLPPGRKLKQSEAKAVFSALSGLDFTDVMRNPGDLNFDKQYICRLYNSTEFTFDIASRNGATYVRCRAVFTEGRPESIKKDETKEKLKETEEKLLLDDKADDFTARHMGWVYEISPYKAKYLTLELSDLTEEQEEIEAAGTPDPNAVLEKIQSESLFQEN